MKKICGILLVLTLTTSSLCATPADAFDWGNFGNKILRSVGISNGGHSSKPKIAKKDKTKPSESKPTILANNRMYQIVDLRSGYKKAELYADRVGGHLAIIDSQEKSRMLYDFMVSQGYDSAYFGLTDEDLNGNWVLPNGQKPKFTNWHSGQPTKEESNERYAMLYRKYKNATWKAGSFSPLLENSNTTAFIIEWDKEVKPQEYKEKVVRKEAPADGGYYEPSWGNSSYEEPDYEEEISG